MHYDLDKSYEILERTPAVLKAQLQGIHDDWTMSNEGPDTFSPYDVVGHLIHGEKTDWPDRIKLILEHSTPQPFVPNDRFAMFDESKGKTLTQCWTNLKLSGKRIYNGFVHSIYQQPISIKKVFIQNSEK